MRADKIHLQRRTCSVEMRTLASLAESRVDTVSGLAGSDEFVYDSAGGIHALAGNSSEPNFRVLQRDCIQLSEGKIVTVQLDRPF